MISRRRFFALPVLSCAVLAGADPPARGADADAEECTSLAGTKVPSGRVRLLANFQLGGASASALAFSADIPEGSRDLFAVVAGGRVLALELLAWQGEDGSRLQTRLSAVPDRLRLRLERSASAPRGSGTRREEWTDYLGWRDESPMADAPVRPVLAGTWQAVLAAQRADIRSMLVVGLRGVPPALVARCPPPRFST